MSGREWEKKLLDLLDEAYRVFRAYAPGGSHLSMFITNEGGHAMGYEKTNGNWDLVVDGFKTTSGVYKYSDGRVCA